MDQLIYFLYILLSVYILCVFIWALLSWLPMVSPGLAHNEIVTSVRRFLDSIVMPYVKLFSFIQPVRLGGGYIDLSALVAIIVLIVARAVLAGML